MNAFAAALAAIIIVANANIGHTDPVLRVLTENAIPVSHPSNVFLIAITRAGKRLVAVGEHGVIIFSDDNGKSWLQARVPVNVSLTSVAFATPLQGWAAGGCGVVLHTNDGGRSWQMQIAGSEVNQLMMTEAQNFNANDSLSPVAAKALRRANIFDQAGPDKPFLSILAMTPKQAFIFGAYRMAIETADGGNSWRDVSLRVDDPVSHNLYGVAADGKHIYVVGETGLVFQSSDGGLTFPQLAQPTTATLFGIIIARTGNILTYGVAGSLFLSTDSGKTWSQITLPTSADLTAARVLSGGQIVLTSQNGNIFMSTDNGQSFHQQGINGTSAFNDLQQAADDGLVFVGDTGVKIFPFSALTP